MRAEAAPTGTVIGLPEERSWAPAEGWATVLVLAVMLFVVGLAVDDARWVGAGPSGESRTWFLPLATLLGGAWGLLGAKARLPTLVVHVAGALVGAVVVIYFVAGSVSAAPDLAGAARHSGCHQGHDQKTRRARCGRRQGPDRRKQHPRRRILGPVRPRLLFLGHRPRAETPWKVHRLAQRQGTATRDTASDCQEEQEIARLVIRFRF